MAAAAVRDRMRGAAVSLHQVGLLATGSSGADVALPGFANMLKGELGL
jgi:3-oxoacyl-[acyl-carrier-protein] synthase-3